MKTYNVPEIAKDVFWVGVKDWNRRLFDALIPLPQGTTYNAYLVKGRDKTALIDTVNPGFEKELEARISQAGATAGRAGASAAGVSASGAGAADRSGVSAATDITKLDYVVMNHAEPDHAGSIPYVMKAAAGATLVTSEKGAKMAQIYYGVPEGRIRKVKEGDRIDLGGKTLEFIDAPWLHWPETMFTYLVEEKVLFSCDFFGSHTAFGFFEDEVPEVVTFAKRYFGEIMMPFRNQGARALQKVKDRNVNVIAPSHGPIHRNPAKILEAYSKWTAGKTERQVIVVYVTMWNSTDSMVKAMVETLLSEGVEVCLHNLTIADIGDIARDLVDSSAIILGAPTVLAGMHPLGVYASYLVKALRPPAKYAAVLSSYGWAGGALKQVGEILGSTGLEVVGAVEVNGPAREEDFAKITELGKQLAAKLPAK